MSKQEELNTELAPEQQEPVFSLHVKCKPRGAGGRRGPDSHTKIPIWRFFMVV